MKGDAKRPKKSESRDISAYVCRAMVYGAISGHGISRDRIERLCERYSDENPRLDVTKMPIFMWSDHGNPLDKAIFALARKWCRKCSIFSDDGKTLLLVGNAAKEIVSKMDFSNAKTHRLKTKTRIECEFPTTKKLKCFNGEKVSDHMKSRKVS